MEYTKADLQQLTSEKLLEIYNFVQQLVGGKVLKKFKNKAVAVELTFKAMAESCPLVGLTPLSAKPKPLSVSKTEINQIGSHALPLWVKSACLNKSLSF